jgi:NADPH:quinone reductase
MLAIRVDVHGGPEVLRPVTVPVPKPGPGEVLVRHEAIGVNFVDAQHRAGSPYPVHLPLVPGIEAAGSVIEVGQGVETFSRGDRVAYAGPMVGAYSEVSTVPAEAVVNLPSRMSASAAAAVLL